MRIFLFCLICPSFSLSKQFFLSFKVNLFYPFMIYLHTCISLPASSVCLSLFPPCFHLPFSKFNISFCSDNSFCSLFILRKSGWPKVMSLFAISRVKSLLFRCSPRLCCQRSICVEGLPYQICLECFSRKIIFGRIQVLK